LDDNWKKKVNHPQVPKLSFSEIVPLILPFGHELPPMLPVVHMELVSKLANTLLEAHRDWRAFL